MKPNFDFTSFTKNAKVWWEKQKIKILKEEMKVDEAKRIERQIIPKVEQKVE